MEEDEKQAFGELQRTYRKRAGKTQEQLAKCLGVTRGTVIAWEHGDALPKDRARIEEMRRCLQLTDQERDALLSAALLVTPQQIWYVPVPRTLYFTGRKEVLEQLRMLLTTQKKAVLTQAITGLGGIGKTQTAREYIHRYQQEYQAVLWVQADSQEVLVSSILTLAQKLALPEREAKEQELIVEAFKQWLEIHSGWLLVLDNVEHLPIIQAVLPSRGQGQILITTRSQAVGTLARPLALKPFTPKQGALLLLRRANLSPSIANMEEATALSETLGGLPLALDQAGAFVQETGHSLAEYRLLFDRAKGALLRRRGMQATEHLDPVTVTFELAFAKVQQISPAAAELLQLCVFLAPAAIPEEMFTDGKDTLPSALQETLVQPLGWQEVVGSLRQYSLLEREEETKTLTVHRLVQDVLREELDQNTQRRCAERAVHLVNATFPSVEFTTWGRCQRYLAHAQACASWIDQWNLTSSEAARLLHQAGYYLMERAQYAQAEAPLKRAREIWEGQESPDLLTLATGLNSLAILYHQQGKYPQALPLFLRALELLEQQRGPNHPLVATALNNLAALYKDQGQYPLALHTYARSLAISEEQLGPNHPEVAICLSNLAELHQTLGHYEEASSLLQRAWPIFMQWGPGHLEFTIILNKVAKLYQVLGQTAQALSLLQLARSLSEQQVGPEHPDTANILNELSTTYFRQGQYDQALALSQQAQEIWEKQLGPYHPYVATCLNNMAAICQALGVYAEAEALIQRALLIRRQQLGAGHPDVAQCLHNLAVIHDIQGQDEQALVLYQQAQAIWEEGLGPDHPEVETNLANQGALFRKLQQEDQAVALESRIQAIRARRSQSS